MKRITLKEFCFGFNAKQVALGESIATESRNITEAWMTRLMEAGLDAEMGGAVLLAGVAKAYGADIVASERGRFKGYTLSTNTAGRAFSRLYASIYAADNAPKSKSEKPMTPANKFLAKVKSSKSSGLTYRAALAAINEAYGI